MGGMPPSDAGAFNRTRTFGTETVLDHLLMKKLWRSPNFKLKNPYHTIMAFKASTPPTPLLFFSLLTFASEECNNL